MPVVPAAPQLRFFATLDVQVGAAIDLGTAPGGHRRTVPILGGRVEGPGIRGRVVPGGADHQVLHTSRLTTVDARYVLETDEGELLDVHNTGVRSGSPEDLAALLRGEDVDPARIYFRTAPRFSASAERWEWLNHHAFVAVGERFPDLVRLHVHTVL